MKLFCFAWLVLWVGVFLLRGQGTQPLVAVHDSEYTRALENVAASGATPTGSGTTGNQWWTVDWHYFVMPEAVKESLRSDGTAFTVVGDSNVIAGVLLTNGVPKYPIVISLASEAILDSEIAPFTNYVAAGGFLFVGSSAFTRTTNGTSRGDFAFANQMGIHMYRSALTNWGQNTSLTKQGDHRITSHIPDGTLTWRLPSSSDEIPWGTSPTRVYNQPHEVWQVVNSNATVLAQGDAFPFVTVKPYGNGYFIYCGAMQPLMGNGGWAPTMYAYLMMRRSIEWAFESADVPVAKLSPWPYQYDAAIMVRHDLENLSNEVAAVSSSAQFEFNNGAKGDYYVCTGTLREDMSPAYNTNTVVIGLRQAMTNYGATIGSHFGGLKNANNASLVHGDYDYWHWGPDEVLDITPSGYPSGSNYAYVSLSRSFTDIETWLSGLMTNGLRVWCAPYFDGTREPTLNIQSQLGVKITGEQKVAPFPHWTLSTQTPNKRFAILSEPLSDWFVGSQISHSMEAGHSVQTVRDEVDFYYSQGFLVNQYSHSLSTGVGPAGAQAQDYITYSFNTNRFPRLWSQNAIGVYNWWLQRSNVQVTASYATNGNQCITTLGIKNSSNTNTTVEVVVPGSGTYSSLQVYTNGVLAGGSQYRTNGSLIKVRVGTAVTNAVVSYLFCALGTNTQIFAQNFDGVTAPALPAGWTSSASGGESAWVTQTAVRDTVPNAASVPDPATVGISDLVSPAITVPSGFSQLTFQNYYNLEQSSSTLAFDGGVLEIKVGTNAYNDIITEGGSFVTGGYTHTIASGSSNALAGRMAWSGNGGGFVPTVVTLPASAAGKTIQLRWRISTDSGGSGTGWRVDSITLSNQLCLCCVVGTNAPVLGALSNRTVDELTLLTVNNAATDADLPNDALLYSLVNPPAGAGIDAFGVITWLPSEAQGPGSYTLTTVVSDNAGLRATNSFNVSVNEVNGAPSFPAPGNRTVAELATLSVTNVAVDADLPANGLSYGLLVFPPGATINTNTGVITWTPSEGQGPGTYTFTTRVTDNGSPNLSVTNSFLVTVLEVNVAPVFNGTPANRTINELSLLSVTNGASDGDVPANVLSYQLVNGPVGAMINGSNGVITWTPSGGQGPSTNLFRTVVTDNGVPVLGATNTFSVVVNDSVVCQYVAVFAENFDGVTAPGLPLGWTSTGSGGQSAWVTTNTVADSGVNAVFSGDSAVAGTNALVSPALVLPLGELVLVFRHSFGLETNFDGGVLEIKIGGGGFVEMGAAGGTFVSGGYNRTISATDSGLAGQEAWSGGSGGYMTTVVSLPAGAAGQTNQLRWRCITDTGNGEAVVGWRVDSLAISNLVCGVNTAPVLPVAPNRTVAELATLTVTNVATDADVPTNGLTYGLLVFPAGATINPNTGVITWTPTEGQGPSSNTVTTVVTDDGSPPLSATNSFTVTVTEVNVAPVFVGTPTNRTIAELTTLTVTNAASDSDVPPNTLTYSLLVFPTGATINTNTGVITWTPTEAQGPSVSNAFTTVVTDNGTPALSATNIFYVTVTEVNVAPVFVGTPTNRTIAELTLLTVTNAASDSDLPANALTYTLTGPATAQISTNGVITWTPGEADGPGTNVFTTVVSDGGLSVTNSFTVTVTEVNVAPVFVGTPTNRTIAELTLLTVTNGATDGDLPANALTYSLLVFPAGAVINTNTGVITWTPSEAQGPGTNVFTTRVVDSGTPALSATNSFTVTVTEVNVAPVLPVPTNRTMDELTLLTVTNTATDADLPANVLTYSLTGPAGAQISTNGIITWTPGEADGPGTNVFTTVVSDGNLMATNSFTVVVLEVNVPPQLPVLNDVTIAELTTLTVTNTASDADLPPNALNYLLGIPPYTLNYLVSGPGGATISTNGVITWTPDEGSGPGVYVFTTVVTDGGGLSATNGFTVTVSEVNSAPVLPVQPDRTIAAGTVLWVTNTASDGDLPVNGLSYQLLTGPTNAVINAGGVITWSPGAGAGGSTNIITTVVTDDGVPALSATNSFLVMVQAPVPPPVIQSITVINGVVTLTWSAVAGQSYRMQFQDGVSGTNWDDVLPDVSATGATASGTNGVGGAMQRFYRIWLVPQE